MGGKAAVVKLTSRKLQLRSTQQISVQNSSRIDIVYSESLHNHATCSPTKSIFSAREALFRAEPLGARLAKLAVHSNLALAIQ
jgi:hypothetical protein